MGSSCTSRRHPDGCPIGHMSVDGCYCDCHQYDDDQGDDDGEDDE
jgi:hypothetical protein